MRAHFLLGVSGSALRPFPPSCAGQSRMNEATRPQVAPSPRVVTGEGGVALWTTRTGPGEEPVPWKWLALFIALAVVLRAIGLNSGLWYDEIRTLLDSVRSPLYQIFTRFPGNNQHTLYSVLAHLSVQAFGEHAWSLRLPAVVLGVATVPMLYLFAREFAGRVEALLASLLLAVAYHHVWFSQNARGYSALAFFAVLGSWLLLRGLRRGKASDFVWYGVASTLGVYTHLTMVFLVVSHAVLCAIPLGVPGLGQEKLRRWRLPAMGFVLAGVFTLVLYAPSLLDMHQFFAKRPSPMEVATPTWAARELLRGLQIGTATLFGVLAGGALLLVGLRSYFKQSRFVAGLFVFPGVVTVAAAVGLRRPIFPRFLFFLVGFALLIVVRGAVEIGLFIGRRRTADPPGTTPAGIAIVGMLVAASAVALTFDYRYPKQDFETALRFVEERKPDGDPVVTVGLATEVYRDYYHRAWAGVTSLEQLQNIRAQGRGVWVLYTLEGYIHVRTPDLMQTLRNECAVQGVFRGTVGGGDVTVCAVPPVNQRHAK